MSAHVPLAHVPSGTMDTMTTTADIGVDLSRYQLGWSDEEDYVFKPKKGLNTDIITEMSWLKGEPQWMLDFRLKSHQRFERRPRPTWGRRHHRHQLRQHLLLHQADRGSDQRLGHGARVDQEHL